MTAFKNKNLGRCCALNEKGRQCESLATVEIRYFGDAQIYSATLRDQPTWVKVGFCDRHYLTLKNE